MIRYHIVLLSMRKGSNFLRVSLNGQEIHESDGMVCLNFVKMERIKWLVIEEVVGIFFWNFIDIYHEQMCWNIVMNSQNINLKKLTIIWCVKFWQTIKRDQMTRFPENYNGIFTWNARVTNKNKWWGPILETFTQKT